MVRLLLQCRTIGKVILKPWFQKPTIKELAAIVAEQMKDSGADPSLGNGKGGLKALTLAPLNMEGDGHRPNLFCVHAAGGIVFTYFTLASLELVLASFEPLLTSIELPLFSVRLY